MSASLGFTSAPGTNARPRPPPVKREGDTSSSNIAKILIAREPAALSAEGSGLVSLRWTQALVALNLLLFAAHVAVIVTTVMTEISFPLTIYETRLQNEITRNFTCIYDHGERDGAKLCTQPDYVSGYEKDECRSAIDRYTDTGQYPSVQSDGSGPLRGAYSLQSALSDEAIGTMLAKYCIIAIESITALYHLTYAATFARILSERRRNPTSSTLEHVLARGGMPGRWHEYALTAGLMSLFISSSGNVFDVYALLGSVLATFGLMYVGAMIEHTLAEGLRSTAAMLLFVPGMALFAVTWVPLVRQLWLDVFKISCQTYETDALPFLCTKPSCFGLQVPIGIFVMVLLVLFGCFALIAAAKVYYVGGWSRPFDNSIGALRAAIGADRARFLLPVYWAMAFVVQSVGFLLFLFAIGPAVAVWRIVADSLVGVLPSALSRETRCPPRFAIALHGLYAAETAYVIASATSKLFLAIFFLASFSSRDW